uniref:Secreted protein n=1 Tax=Anopheles coluzzii TaxID=1518534 RepID=A0A8W7P9C9_ANOCL
MSECLLELLSVIINLFTLSLSASNSSCSSAPPSSSSLPLIEAADAAVVISSAVDWLKMRLLNLLRKPAPVALVPYASSVRMMFCSLSYAGSSFAFVAAAPSRPFASGPPFASSGFGDLSSSFLASSPAAAFTLTSCGFFASGSARSGGKRNGAECSSRYRPTLSSVITLRPVRTYWNVCSRLPSYRLALRSSSPPPPVVGSSSSVPRIRCSESVDVEKLSKYFSASSGLMMVSFTISICSSRLRSSQMCSYAPRISSMSRAIFFEISFRFAK